MAAWFVLLCEADPEPLERMLRECEGVARLRHGIKGNDVGFK